MIIYYAFTATQLINIFNICSNLQSQENAVLVIDLVSRIPKLLVKQIISSNKFRKVIVIGKYKDNGDIILNRNCISKYATIIEHIYLSLKYNSPIRRQISYIGGLYRFLRDLRKYHSFFNMLRKSDVIDSCNEIYVGTFGCQSLMIINVVLKRVKKLSVNLVDEGTANYYLSKETMCLGYKDSRVFHDKLVCKYYHLDNVFFESLLEITKNNYLLQPSAYVYSNQYVLKKIPQVNSKNPDVLSLLMNSISQPDIEMYKHKHVYYMLQEPGEKFEKCLSIVLEQVNHSELLLKEHPSFRIMDELSNEYDLSSVVIDKRTDAFIFEALCTHYSFDDRAIITNFSSSAFMPKFMFGSEPSVIFLYNLILDDDKIITELDYLVDALKKLYSNPTKVYVPKTFDELSGVLIEINSNLQLASS